MNRAEDRDGLRIYLAEVERYPLPGREEEAELARRYKTDKDEEAGKRLVTSNLRFVIKVALTYKNYGARLMDLIQEGNMGLMKAVERFDPDKGYRLISYAVWWIKAYVQNYIIRSWSVVKLGTTQAQRKLFYRLGDLPEPEDYEDHLQNVSKLAERIHVTEGEVHDMGLRMKAHDLSLDDLIADGSRASFADSVVDYRPHQEEALSESQERQELRNWAGAAVSSLNIREQYIVEKRLLSEEPSTLKELGAHFGITRERARQIEKAALEKLRRNYAESSLAAA